MTEKDFDLTHRMYLGFVVDSDAEPEDEWTKIPSTSFGKKQYTVHIPELMPNIDHCSDEVYDVVEERMVKNVKGVLLENENYMTENVLTKNGSLPMTNTDHRLELRNYEYYYIKFECNNINSGKILHSADMHEEPC